MGLIYSTVHLGLVEVNRFLAENETGLPIGLGLVRPIYKLGLGIFCTDSTVLRLAYTWIYKGWPLGIDDMCEYLRTSIVCLKAQLLALQQQLLDLLHPGAQVFLKPAHYF
jgi:hypothetical protein